MARSVGSLWPIRRARWPATFLAALQLVMKLEHETLGTLALDNVKHLDETGTPLDKQIACKAPHDQAER